MAGSHSARVILGLAARLTTSIAITARRLEDLTRRLHGTTGQPIQIARCGASETDFNLRRYGNPSLPRRAEAMQARAVDLEPDFGAVGSGVQAARKLPE